MPSDRSNRADQAAAGNQCRRVQTPRLPNASAAALVKINLPPLIGRRDALCDRAADLAERCGSEGGSASGRLHCTAALLALLDRAEADTAAVISMLSSPDTTKRERTCLDFLHLLRLHATALHACAEMDSMFSDGPSEKLPERSAAVAAAEEALGRQLTGLVQSFRSRLKRYRNYAGNSFSEVNAERYRNAYRACFDAEEFNC